MKTTSLELSKQLKEAGYPQEDHAHYWGGIGNWGLWCKHVIDDMDSRETRFEWVASPTADEILDVLPMDIKGHKSIQMGKWDGKYVIRYELLDNSLAGFREDEESLAAAAAKMWLHLKKEGLI